MAEYTDENEEIYELKNEIRELNKKLDKMLTLQERQIVNSSKHKESRNKIVDEKKVGGTIFRIREFDSTFMGDIHESPGIYFAQELGGRLRRLEVSLSDTSVAFDGGSFQSSCGQVEFGKLKLSAGDMLKGIIRKQNSESFFQPVVYGNGEVQMRSSLKFLQVIQLKSPTKVVLEKGLYLASSTGLPDEDFRFGVNSTLNISSLTFSKKNAFQLSLIGQGLIALELPVHPEELERHRVTPNNPYKVNGDYVLYSVGNIKRTVQKSSTIFGTFATGAGLVEVYEGNGEVITAPTLGYYGAISSELEGKELSTTASERLSDTDTGKHKKGGLSGLFLN